MKCRSGDKGVVALACWALLAAGAAGCSCSDNGGREDGHDIDVDGDQDPDVSDGTEDLPVEPDGDGADDTMADEGDLPEDPPAEEDVDPYDWVSYWIDLAGSDENDCHTKETACRTWSHVLETAGDENIGVAPVDIIFVCNTYLVAEEGQFVNSVPLGGTDEAPVRIRGETPRCATLEGNGETVLALSRYNDVSPQHVIVDGLRITQIDRCTEPRTCNGGSNEGNPCTTHADCPEASCLCTGGSPNTVGVAYADYFTIRNCEIVKNNRYYNAQPLVVAYSDHVRIERNRVYGSHRHMINFYKGPHRCEGGEHAGQLCSPDDDYCTGSTCTIVASDGIIESVVTENYVNSCVGGPTGEPDCYLYSADLEAGWPSHSTPLSDECVAVYNANDVAVINNILENCEHLGANAGFGGGDGNLWANNIIYKYIIGFLTVANTGTEASENTAAGNRFFNNVGIAAIRYGGMLADGAGTRFENNTLIRSNDTDLPGVDERDPSLYNGTRYGIEMWRGRRVADLCSDPPIEVTFLRNFVAGTSTDAVWANAFSLSNACTITGEYNAWCEILGVDCGDSPIYTGGDDVTTLVWENELLLDPGALEQYVYIPDGDPRATAAAGEPVGADIRCIVNEYGEKTAQPFWDMTTGPFADNPQDIVYRLLPGLAEGEPPPECR
jgi:hypothetical protein